jgi:ABC-type phosphate/phosphonate transport system substrate-binding protein
MFAALPMYDRPDNRAAHDRLWGAIRDGLRARGVEAPEALDRKTFYSDGWARPDLTLGQICILPYRTKFVGKVTPIAAPDYGLEGCEPGYYRSLFVVRKEDPAERPQDLAGRPMAYSDALSQSGYGAVASWARKTGFRLNPALRTGAHIESVRAVASGKADFATIDAQTLRILTPTMPETHALKIIGATPPSPGMTFITALGNDPAPFRAAIGEAIAGLSPADASILGLRGIVVLPPEAYDPVLTPPLSFWAN